MTTSKHYLSQTPESHSGARGMIIVKRAFIVFLSLSILSIPAMGMSSGPGYENSDGDPTAKYGCSCHNNGAASTRAVVMVTGVPVMYELGESYQMTIKVADSLTLSGGDGNTATRCEDDARRHQRGVLSTAATRNVPGSPASRPG